ncbi:acyltransferase family protein [Nesterenkonia jeotgali]|uniref:Peptidoglycan/LPS O-acetylase OafA/YrhL n=1 Tax=Nesterenkonia jeotgali TaxID=317018 RepID=A0A839FL31_9MICC|nr:acyltransferase family protein [Nesterenkonia jeotgali]MBA8920546.1 peptidoglycan/LPS O-acetylase OafA/YrhL [Nesterenkonia jeotgali]
MPQPAPALDECASTASRPALGALPERRYRPELHGLRGLAIAGVVLFHLFGAGRVSGGIDIFLAVSGFLFTAMLLREAGTTGTIDFLRYFSRLARRILAPAALVIAATTLVGLLVLPLTRHAQLITEARASLLYFENFELVRSQLSYEAAGAETSPFQHFWSLSVQGQFYLIWPVVALLAVGLARRSRLSPTAAMATLIGLLMLASFATAVLVQQQNQAEAYLLTQTRIWELGFGGLLALLGARLTLPPRLRTSAGWLGLVLIISCGFALDGAALFPGPWALWPLAGMALVLASATPSGAAQGLPHPDPSGAASAHHPPRRQSPEGPGTAAGLLATAPFTRLGDIAYGLFLWHWPLLIFTLELRGTTDLTLPDAVLVLASSLLLGWLTFRFLERPLARVPTTAARAQPGRAGRMTLRLAAGTLVIGGVGSTVYVQMTTAPQQDGLAMAGVDRALYPGADIIQAESSTRDVEFYPELSGISHRIPEYARTDCHQPTGDQPGSGEVLVCEDAASPTDPEKTIVLAGGSHAGHWHNAWIILAERHNWEVLVSTKGGCVFRANDPAQPSTCDDWNDAFPEMLQARAPDLVVTPGTAIPREDGEEEVHDGAPDRWKEITRTGTDLLLLRGTPRAEANIPDCLAEGGDELTCAPDFGKYAERDPLSQLDLPENTYSMDLTEHFCPQEQCSAIIGNVLVYRDSHHLTNEYVETMVPHLEQALQESLPHLFTPQPS